MTTLHTLRRTYALTFSELALVTGVGTRELAAFEYHGAPLALHERQRIAAFFGIEASALEGGFVSRYAAEPTLSSVRARALVLAAAALAISWSLQTARADERDSLAASLDAASAYVAEVQSTISIPAPVADSLGMANRLLNPAPTAPDPAPAVSTALPEPSAPADSSLPASSTPEPTATPPLPTAAPTIAQPDPTPQPAAPSAPQEQSSAAELADMPELPKIWPTPAPPTVTPTVVTRARIRDAYENNYDFDHAAPIEMNAAIPQLNFVCPDDGDCADNDFFQVPLVGGECYRVATGDLSSGIDTNVIVYGPERNARPPLGGNDNAAPGELRSQVDLCVPGRGSKPGFILVGNRDNQRPPEPVSERTYTLQVTRLESPVNAGEPHRCPLAPERGSVAVVQGWGVGTHAPAAQWGGVDLIIRGGPTAGTPIVASHAGRVQVVLNSWPGGNYVAITSDDGWRTAYAHLSTVLVQNGEYVEPGRIIGTVGQTGWANGPHLHYETWHHGVNVDPTPWLFCD